MTLTDFLRARIAAREERARVAEHDDMDLTLAECEAKLAIVKWCGEREQVWVGTLADDPESPRPERFVQGPIKHPADAVVLRYLALPYAVHPDYREEWRP